MPRQATAGFALDAEKHRVVQGFNEPLPGWREGAHVSLLPQVTALLTRPRSVARAPRTQHSQVGGRSLLATPAPARALAPGCTSTRSVPRTLERSLAVLLRQCLTHAR